MRKLAFVLAATDYGPLIVNRLDYCVQHGGKCIGIGNMLLETGACDPDEVELYSSLVTLRKHHHGESVIMLDCGANVGTMTTALARVMYGWGTVLAIEAQERIFYALAGNIVLGNHHNARAMLAAVGDRDGMMSVPVPNYVTHASFGSLEMIRSSVTEAIGQRIDYSVEAMNEIPIVRIDSLNLTRLDLLKIDVERMEIAVLNGARGTIERLHPILSIEHLKVGVEAIGEWLRSVGYTNYLVIESVIVAIHPDDPVNEHMLMRPEELSV